MEEAHPWIKIKGYPHIGFPLKLREIGKIESYVTNPKNIKSHSFLPFIHRELVQRKFRADVSKKKEPGNKKRRKRIRKNPKIRHIYYASHLDSQIFSYYSYILSEKYEELLQQKSFNNSVVAYRKLVSEKEKKGKCNIDFAYDTFEFINSNKDKKLSVVVADVTKFFDRLDHKILKQKWAQVWNRSITLEADHYNVYKSLTKVRYINEDLIFRNYKNYIWVKKGVPNSSSKKTETQIRIKHKKFLKEKNAIAFCDISEFYKNGIKLVSKSTQTQGIPQGTALSATLANIYMLDFDQHVQDYIDKVGGFYQRYSDDLIIVVPRENEKEAIELLRDWIENLVKLEIHPEKTKVYHFQNENSKFIGYEVDENTGEKKNKALEYLGFEYDGQRVLIKTSGFSKYARSMKRTFKRSVSLAKFSKSSDDKIHKSNLYKRFTYRGSSRRQVNNHNEKKLKHDWGNYLTYVEKANAKFYNFNNGDFIKKQSRKSWGRFHKLMKYSQIEIDKHKVK